MLVLSRKKDEAIRIGGFGDLFALNERGELVPVSIDLMVVEIRGDKTRIGIAAPKSIRVHREEIFDAIRAKSPAAAERDGVAA